MKKNTTFKTSLSVGAVKLYDLLIPLLITGLVAYFALSVSACGQRMAPLDPAGKVNSSGQY